MITAKLLTFPSRAVTPPPAIDEPEPCACCLGRQASIWDDDIAVCAGCRGFIQRGALVAQFAADVWCYEPRTAAAALHVEGGWQAFDTARR